MRFSLGAGFVTLHGVDSLLKGCCHLFQFFFNRTRVVIVFLGCGGQVGDGDIFNVPIQRCWGTEKGLRGVVE